MPARKSSGSPTGDSVAAADDNIGVWEDFVHLARLALSGRAEDVTLFLRRVSRRYRGIRPEVADALVQLLRQSPVRASILKSAPAVTAAPPVDANSRFQLVRQEQIPVLHVEPVFTNAIEAALLQLVQERLNIDRLLAAGLEPTPSALLVGPPGVGKTLAARYVARELELPLFVLDLSAVMSSLLGRTGMNLRYVLDFARQQPCVLLLDELDAVAKRRDDDTEIGELKRLVTVLLQEIDDWTSDRLLLAATNHPDLLDPAVWRRFATTLEFPLPSAEALRRAIPQFLANDSLSTQTMEVLVAAFEGRSFSDLERSLLRARRSATLRQESLEDAVLVDVTRQVRDLPHKRRVELAELIVKSGIVSQRQAYEVTGVSRDTIRKRVSESVGG